MFIKKYHKLLRLNSIEEIEEILERKKKQKLKNRFLFSVWAQKFKILYSLDKININQPLSLKAFVKLKLLRVVKVYQKNLNLKRTINLYSNFKSKKFQFKKKREERRFWKIFLKATKTCIEFPFLTKNAPTKYWYKRGYIFFVKLPERVKPLRKFPRFRYRQPILLKFNQKKKTAHNGLRLRKLKRL